MTYSDSEPYEISISLITHNNLKWYVLLQFSEVLCDWLKIKIGSTVILIEYINRKPLTSWYIFHQNYDKNCETGYGVNGLSDYTAEWMMRNYYIPEGPPSSHSMWTPCEKGRQHRVYVNM